MYKITKSIFIFGFLSLSSSFVLAQKVISAEEDTIHSYSIKDSREKHLFLKKYSVAEKPNNILGIIECWEDSVFINDNFNRKNYTPKPYHNVIFRIDEKNKNYNSENFFTTWGFEGSYYEAGIQCSIYPTKKCVYVVGGGEYPLPDSFFIRLVKLPKGSVTPADEKIKIGNLYFKAEK